MFERPTRGPRRLATSANSPAVSSRNAVRAERANAASLVRMQIGGCAYAVEGPGKRVAIIHFSSGQSAQATLLPLPLPTIHPLLRPGGHVRAFGQLMTLLSRHRQLTWEMTKREMQERYAGQVLGTLWAIGYPIFMMAIYVVVFAYVFRLRMGDPGRFPLDYTSYLLSGLIPWMAFQEAMQKGATVVVSNAGLVKQVVFPVEILPVKGVLASMVSALISLALLGGYVLWTHGSLHWSWLLLPLLLVLQGLGMVGVCYLLSSVGVFFRDVKDIIAVVAAAGLYVAPILYVPEMLPRPIELALYANPFSYMVWCFQDALYYGRIMHPAAWIVFPALSLFAFYTGYRVFRKLRPMFGNVL